MVPFLSANHVGGGYKLLSRPPARGRVKMEPFVLLTFFPLFTSHFWSKFEANPCDEANCGLDVFPLFCRHFRLFCTLGAQSPFVLFNPPKGPLRTPNPVLLFLGLFKNTRKTSKHQGCFSPCEPLRPWKISRKHPKRPRHSAARKTPRKRKHQGKEEQGKHYVSSGRVSNCDGNNTMKRGKDGQKDHPKNLFGLF